MAIQIKIWQVINGHLQPIETNLAENGRRETDDLESWIDSE